MKIFIDFSKLSDGVTDGPRDIIVKIICLLNKQHFKENKNIYFLNGSTNKDGFTVLPLDPITDFSCDCPNGHNYDICTKVDFVFYAIRTKN